MELTRLAEFFCRADILRAGLQNHMRYTASLVWFIFSIVLLPQLLVKVAHNEPLNLFLAALLELFIRTIFGDAAIDDI